MTSVLALGLILGLMGLAAYLWRQSYDLEQRLIILERKKRQLVPQLTYATQIRDMLLDLSQDGILILNAQQEILFANQAVEAILEPEIVGETLIAATRHYELDTLVQNVSLDDPEPSEKRIELNQQIIRARVMCAQTDQGVMTLLILHDETELHRLGRARREMVANISHELRTPITNISLSVDTLLDGAMEKKKHLRNQLKNIQHQTATLTQLVQEMRDLSSIESGHMPARLTPTPAQTIVDGCLGTLVQLAESKNQSIIIDMPSDMVVLADANQIERVIKNIIHNAIKFTPKGGEIRVHAKVVDQEDALFMIQDTGVGISEENLNRIFERFYQENLARTDGTGLGLAIARHIILAHGGRIWAESTLGEGTAFYFRLNLAELPQERALPTPNQPDLAENETDEPETPNDK